MLMACADIYQLVSFEIEKNKYKRPMVRRLLKYLQHFCFALHQQTPTGSAMRQQQHSSTSYHPNSTSPSQLPPLSDQPRLPRDQTPIPYRRPMSPRQIPITRHILIQIRQHLQTPRRIPPITHQIHRDTEQAHKLHTRGLHAHIRRVSHQSSGSARSLDVGENGVALGAQGEGEERRADVGCDASDDDLRLVGCFDGGAEVGVVPGTTRISCQHLIPSFST
jgi:hypothetical protein